MKLVEIPAPDFDLAMTLNSGQVFHWETIGSGFLGTIGEQPVYVEQWGDALKVRMEGGAPPTPGSQGTFRTGSQEIAPQVVKLVKNYFALDHPLTKICSSFPKDPAMN